MILFTSLVIILAIVGVGAIISLGMGGIAFVLTYLDVIVCIGLIYLVIRHFVRK